MNSHPALRELTAQADFAARFSETVQKVSSATDAAEAVILLKQAASLLGADTAAFGSFIRDDPSHASYRILLACDPVWCLEYGRRAWHLDDPWLNYALEHSEPIRARELAAQSAAQRSLIELAKQFGVESAVIVPAPSGGQVTRVGVLLLGSPIPDYFEDDGFIALKVQARSLAMELHEWWIDQIKRELIAERRITPEDIVLLRRERLGQSTKKIASELDASPSSIDSRFQRINAKLDVPNRRLAAHLAAEYGLI
jgi:DNA-binding CsgD family transcriptional regulator